MRELLVNNIMEEGLETLDSSCGVIGEGTFKLVGAIVETKVYKYINLDQFELIGNGGTLGEESTAYFLLVNEEKVAYCHNSDSTDESSYMIVDRLINAREVSIEQEVALFEAWVSIKNKREECIFSYVEDAGRRDFLRRLNDDSFGLIV